MNDINFELADKLGYDTPFGKKWTDEKILIKQTSIIPFVILKKPNINEIELNKPIQFDFIFVGSSNTEFYNIELTNTNPELRIDNTRWNLQNGSLLSFNTTVTKKIKYVLKFVINSKYQSNIEINLFECFCNRDFRESEFKDLIISLRKMNGYDKKVDVLFDLPSNEKILNPTWNSFQENINGVFSKYSITKCIHKIHFIAQTYHESFHYRRPYENLIAVKDSYRGGVDFQGRGIKQITHDDNYLAYYDFIMGTTYFEDYYKNFHRPNEGVTLLMDRVANINFGKELLENLKMFAKRLSTELIFSCDSAGWFWMKNNLNSVSENDDFKKLTKIINGGENGLEERENYTNQLKEIMLYKECKLTKKNYS